jgi:hypothetical protein
MGIPTLTNGMGFRMTQSAVEKASKPSKRTGKGVPDIDKVLYERNASSSRMKPVLAGVDKVLQKCEDYLKCNRLMKNREDLC